jgi:6-phosphofructokinase 1
MAEKKKIAILTSGGDAPGMNAAIRAVVRAALYFDMEVFGIRDGYLGLKNDDMSLLSAGSVGDIIHRGGTMLGTARLPEFATDPEIRRQCYDNLRARGIEGLVVCGGDGSYRGASLVQKESGGINVVGLPGTIDNDLAYTDYTIGFDTAVNTCVDNINKLRDTMASHGRVSVVDVMGRSCGDIAVHSGIAAGAEAILIPEIKKTDNQWLDYIVQKLRTSFARGKKYGIIVMAEGVYAAPKMQHFTADYIASWLNANADTIGHRVDARGCVIGHVQRGGSPTASDRILSARMGEMAVDLLRENKGGLCVGIVKNRMVAVEIDKALSMRRRVDKHLIELADILAR